MSTTTIFLKKLFLDKELVEKIEQEASFMEIPENEGILNMGDYVKVVPLVISGKIKVMRTDESGREILLYYINPGESCALSIAAGLNKKKSVAFAITDSNTQLLAIPIDKLESMIRSFPYLNKYVLELFHQRFNELIDFIDAISFKNIDARLLEYLQKKNDSINDNFVKLTHKQIADDLGTAREVVSRLLKQLEKQGKVKNHRGKIEIISLV